MAEPFQEETSAENPNENRHNSAIAKLLESSTTASAAYISSRREKPRRLMTDMTLASGSILIGLGLWQIVAGGDIPNIFETMNVLNYPLMDEVGQIITDTSPDLKIIAGIGAVASATDNSRESENQSKPDIYLLKAYIHDAFSRIDFRHGRNNE